VVRESFSIRSSRAEGSEPVADDGAVVDWGGETGRRWLQVADKVEAQLAPVSDVLFPAAGLRAGERVLDVGCGLGSTTRRAAGIVGPSGAVTGLDVAVAMIDEARRIPAPGPAGASAPIEWIVADAQTARLPAGSYDAVISRFGVLFFDDPVAAFAHLAGTTRPGGRLCVAVWQRRDRSPLLQLALDVASSVAAAHGHPIDIGEPGAGPFAFGEAAFVRPIVEDAGWVDVDVTEHLLDMLLFGPGTVEQAVEAGLTFGPLQMTLHEAPAAVVDAVRADLVEELRPRHDGTGVRMPGAIAVVSARRP
jgi:SAM-dependent methyltransferase